MDMLYAFLYVNIQKSYSISISPIGLNPVERKPLKPNRPEILLAKMKTIGNSSRDSEVIAKLKAYVYDIIGCCQDVHHELGSSLNEYIYQEALKFAFEEKQIPFEKEFYFQVYYRGHPLPHKHYMDFLCKGDVVLECKAIAALGPEQRQQLWNYMRLAHIPIGILYNFAPSRDQCEKYYYDENSKTIQPF